ncbi:preprotein translocase subunit YajC [Kocuria sp.]|uniref:preprotein translocase subunit YajC n=1 Tax=Kocuria sp. TaxID=1871328 RepID=UPI0026DB2A20|nr:preprotein translocase subunit YajC [Kocuria sp.]MDO4919473.1 preprotein translocase subunit YajC [Kocuria sp.]
MTLLAETQEAATGGTGWFLPVMLVVMVLLLWLPMRRQKKAQAEMKAKQASMEPGTRVMTSFGLYGTLRDMDREQNKAVLEISPGQLVTVHSQTVTTVVDETPVVPAHADAVADAQEARPVEGDVDGSTAADVRGTGTPGTGTAVRGSGEAPRPAEETEHRTWRDARERDERDNPTT